MLLDAVSIARARVLEERASGGKAACLRARAGLIRALEAYSDALGLRGVALPHQLQTELRLYRLLEEVH